MAAAQLVIWSPTLGERRTCCRDEITWLDRHLLSAGSDPTLHRSPRCAGLRYVDHGWELFSHDTSHEVYLARYTGDACLHPEQIRAGASHVLPVARGRLQPFPVRLGNGSWVAGVGPWILRLDADGCDDRSGGQATPLSETATQEHRSRAPGAGARGRRDRPLPGAAARVRAYFDRKGIARVAIAYYYQEFILGAVGPQPVPIIDVAVALDLTGDAAVSEYKKELQRLIWNEQGHQRELAEFLIANGLIGTADAELASRVAAANERSGATRAAWARLRYRQRRAQRRPVPPCGSPAAGRAGERWRPRA